MNSLEGKFRLKKPQMKEREKWKKRAITDLNTPNGSQHVPFQSHEFEQNGRRRFGGFQPHFHLSMTSQMQSCKAMKNESSRSPESFVRFV